MKSALMVILGLAITNTAFAQKRARPAVESERRNNQGAVHGAPADKAISTDRRGEQTVALEKAIEGAKKVDEATIKALGDIDADKIFKGIMDFNIMESLNLALASKSPEDIKSGAAIIKLAGGNEKNKFVAMKVISDAINGGTKIFGEAVSTSKNPKFLDFVADIMNPKLTLDQAIANAAERAGFKDNISKFMELMEACAGKKA
jgi:hypothetical protein